MCQSVFVCASFEMLKLAFDPHIRYNMNEDKQKFKMQIIYILRIS